MRRFICGLFGQTQKMQRTPIRRRFRPTVLRLEDRIVPSQFQWTGEGLDHIWSDSLNWRDANWQHGVPGAKDDASISGGSGTPTIIVNGQAAANTLTFPGCNLIINGALTVNTGQISGGLTLNGTFTINGSGTFYLTGFTGIYLNGDIRLTTGETVLAMVSLNQAIDVEGSSSISGLGTCWATANLDLNADLTVGHFNLSDSAASGPGNLIVADTSTWWSDEFYGSGNVIVADSTNGPNGNPPQPALTLGYGGSSGGGQQQSYHGALTIELSVNMYGCQLLNYGSVQLGDGANSGAIWLYQGAIVSNQPGAVLTLTSESGVEAYLPSNGTLRNTGSIVTQQAGTNRQAGCSIIPDFENSATVRVQSGMELDVEGGGSSTGTFQIDASAVLGIVTNNFLLDVGALIQGDGPLVVDGATITLAEGKTIPKVTLQNGGSINGGAFSLTISQQFDWKSGTLLNVNLTTQGTVTIEGASTVLKALNAVTWRNYSAVNVTGTADPDDPNGTLVQTISFFRTDTINNFGQFNLQCDATFFDADRLRNIKLFINGTDGGAVGKVIQSYGSSAASPGSTFTVRFRNDGGELHLSQHTITFGTFFDQWSGTTFLEGGVLRRSSLNINVTGGTVTGTGTIVLGAGGTFVMGGTLDLGPGTGVLVIHGNYEQTSTGILKMNLGGTGAGVGYNQIQHDGTVTLDNSPVLQLNLLPGFTPQPTDHFQIFLGTGTDASLVDGVFSVIPPPNWFFDPLGYNDPITGSIDLTGMHQ